MEVPKEVGEVAVRLKELTPEEKMVLRLRFNLDNTYYHTLNDIAAGLQLEADGVRAIEQRALRKLAGLAT